LSTKFTTIADDITHNKKTGLLSLVIEDSKNHLKVFFAEGQIYHIGYGDLKNSACLLASDKLSCIECFFTDQVKLTDHGELALSTAEVIERLKASDKTEGSEKLKESGVIARNPADVLKKIQVAFIRQIGPIGEVLFSRIVEGWRPPSSPTKQNYKALIELIKGQIENEKDRNEFVKEAGALILD
jgi:hypothetical protein